MKRLTSQHESNPGLSKRSKKAALDTAIAAVKTLLNLTAAASDAFPPLKSATAGLQFIVTHAGKVGENRDLIETLSRRIQKIQDSTIALESVADTETEKRRREELARKLEEINRTLVEPSQQQGRLERILKAQDDNVRIQEYLTGLEQCLFDYQMSLMQDIYALNVTSGERDLLDKLTRAKDAAYNASDDRPRCLENTRVEIQEMLRDWAQDSNTRQIYWLNGIAGSGKTTIAQSFTEYLAEERKLGASFFCSRESTHRSDLKMLFPTIAFQLSQANNPDSPRYRKALVRVLEKNMDLASLSLRNQFKDLIIAPVEDSPMETIILIDALDECKDPNSISIILQLLSDSIAQIPTLKFFITSRPESHIRSGFRLPSLRPTTDTMILQKIGATSVAKDIRLFLEKRLSDIAKNRSDFALCDVWPTGEDLDHLTTMSAGLFIFASTAVKFVGGAADDPRERLRQILDQSGGVEKISSYCPRPYRDLDTLYLNILESTSPQTNPSRVRDILGLLVIARDPLSVVTAAKFLRVEPSVIVSSLRSLHSIIHVPKEPMGYLLFHHKSLPDFLTDSGRCTDPLYLVDTDRENHTHALCCLQLMEGSTKKNICGLPRYAMNSSLNPAIRDQCIPEALRYCCRHWANHVLSDRKCDEHLPMLQVALERFLTTHQLLWFEVLSLFQELRGAVEALTSLREWLTLLGNQYQPLLDRVSDGYRFVLSFFDVIEASVTHIYHSALVFSPEESLLRQSHSKALEKEASTIFGTSSSWGPLRTMGAASEPIQTLEYAHDGRMIAAVTEHQCLVFLSVTGERIVNLDFSGGVFLVPSWNRLSPSFSCDNKTIAVKAGRQTIVLFDIESGAIHSTLSTSNLSHEGIIIISFHPHHAHILLSICYDGSAAVWNVTSGECLSTLTVGRCTSACWLACKRELTIVIGTYGGDVTTWAIDPPQGSRHVLSSGSSGSEKLCTVSASLDGLSIASGTDQGLVTIYNLQSESPTRCSKAIWHHQFHGCIESLKFSSTSPSTTVLAAVTTFDKNQLWIYSLGHNNYDMVASYGHHSSISSVALSPNAKFVASGAITGEINTWETNQTGRSYTEDVHFRIMRQHLQRRVLTYSWGNGEHTWLGSMDGLITIWNPETRELLQKLDGHSNLIHDVVFLHDGIHIISIDHHGKAVLWNLLSPGADGWLSPCCEAWLSPPLGRAFLVPFAVHVMPGFYYIREHHSVECWALGEAGEDVTRLVLMARGDLLGRSCSISQVFHLEYEQYTSSVQLVVEYEDGEQDLLIWRNANFATPLRSNMETLQSVLERTGIQFCEARPPSVLISNRIQPTSCRITRPRHGKNSAWIIDEQGQKRLWLPASLRRHCILWHATLTEVV